MQPRTNAKRRYSDKENTSRLKERSTVNSYHRTPSAAAWRTQTVRCPRSVCAQTYSSLTTHSQKTLQTIHRYHVTNRSYSDQCKSNKHRADSPLHTLLITALVELRSGEGNSIIQIPWNCETKSYSLDVCPAYMLSGHTISKTDRHAMTAARNHPGDLDRSPP